MNSINNSCLKCIEKNNSLFNYLSKDELKILNKHRYSVSYNSGEIICQEGSRFAGLICLNRGKVKIIRRGANGTEQIIGLKKKGDFIGFNELMGGDSCLAYYVALEDSTVCIIKKKDFFKVVKSNKNLAFKIIKILASDVIKSNERLVNLTQKHIRARLAETLVMLDNIYGINPNNGSLNVNLKRSDLAQLSNMTTSNAIRILSYFNQENLVEVDHRNIKINDLNSLKEISDFDW